MTHRRTKLIAILCFVFAVFAQSTQGQRAAFDARFNPLVAHTAATARQPVPVHRTAPDPDDCFACHDDESMTMERDGKEIALHVGPDEYAASAHGSLNCTDCHVGYDPDEEPHSEQVVSVNCASCHEDADRSASRSAHRRELTCSSCHTNSHTARGLELNERSCASCHSDAFDEVAQGAHVNGRAGPSCLDCHSSHRFRAAESSTCLSCHGEREFVGEHVPGEDLEAVLSYAESIHAGVTECSDCHDGHLVLPGSNPASRVSRQNLSATCSKCHEDVAAEYSASEHGRALAEGFESAPACTDCHGEHDIRAITDSESPVSREHEIVICLQCHLNTPEVQRRMTHTAGFVASYDKSVHGRAAAAGNRDAAICSDCHGAHEEMKAANPRSPINKFRISRTCGSCHEDIRGEYEESIHGVALRRGVADSPTCTSCHAEHEIIEHSRRDSPVAALNVSAQVCSPCHDSYKLSSKYGFPSDRPSSFGDSYHGLAGRFGSVEAANCASCHGVHDIQPSTDPRSSIHPANLVDTCGSCHPGANINFARGRVHIVRTPEGDKLLYWISTIYILVIIATIGSMAVHNGLDWWRKLVDRYRERLAPAAALVTSAHGRGLYVRMTVNERIQHALLAISFILLVITGFMLKFPDAWWVVALRDLLGDRLFGLRGLVHRIAAVVMVADSLYHIYYVAFTERGRSFMSDILFRTKDFKDLVGMVRYNAGVSSRRPRFDRFNYVEKAEYWALIWGTIVMTVTGIVLWFENQFMGQFSKLFVDVNETIHYYEAWLAFLAIVVWHFYYVIFNPDVYPMNFTWITGKVTEEEMEREHPLELERLRGERADAGPSLDDMPGE